MISDKQFERVLELHRKASRTPKEEKELRELKGSKRDQPTYVRGFLRGATPRT